MRPLVLASLFAVAAVGCKKEEAKPAEPAAAPAAAAPAAAAPAAAAPAAGAEPAKAAAPAGANCPAGTVSFTPANMEQPICAKLPAGCKAEDAYTVRCEGGTWGTFQMKWNYDDCLKDYRAEATDKAKGNKLDAEGDFAKPTGHWFSYKEKDGTPYVKSCLKGKEKSISCIAQGMADAAAAQHEAYCKDFTLP
jgi:hypothetical protein